MVYVARKAVVARSLARLREQKTHTLFAGYLYLQQKASQLGHLQDLQPDFTSFFKRFFVVGNHPLGTPYIKLFTEQKASTENLWLNENVAGSYAPSSLRPNQPFRQVVQIEGKKYSLPRGHAQRAFEHLLYCSPVQATDLAVVLYRDFGLLGEHPTIEDLVGIFAHEFGYASAPDATPNEDFGILFSMESASTWDDDWLESQDVPGMPETARTGRSPNQVRTLTAEDLLSPQGVPGGRGPALREFLVEGLLSFKEETRFRFGQLNILIGPNGSGKSNLLDCLRILRNAPLDIQATFSGTGFEEWLYRGVSEQSGRALLQVTAEVPELPDPILHQIRLGPSISSRAPLEEVVSNEGAGDELRFQFFVGSHRGGATIATAGRRRRERQLDPREYDPFQSILSQIRDVAQYPEITRLGGLYAGLRIYSEWSFGRTSNLREATPAGRSGTTLSEAMDDLALVLDGLQRTVAHDKIRARLQELKETYRDYGTRVLFGRVGLELVETPFEQTPLPANRLSDGTLRFLALAAILLHPDPPPLVCIEEPELGMHPDMIRMVADMIIDARDRTQLVVTTHSEHLLSALQDDFDALFAFDAGPTGSVVRRFSQEEYQDWRHDHSLGELWTSGELGGNRW